MNYTKSWNIVREYTKKYKIDTEIEFHRGDFVNFETNEKFDFIVSDAVFEHCTDLNTVVSKCFKYLNNKGIMYASYGGPMWLTYGGDHFSGRDEVNNGFNHLLLDTEDYNKYVEKNIGSFEYELNEGGVEEF